MVDPAWASLAHEMGVIGLAGYGLVLAGLALKGLLGRRGPTAGSGRQPQAGRSRPPAEEHHPYRVLPEAYDWQREGAA